MEDLSEFDSNFKKKQEELAAKQAEFEVDQDLSERSAEYEEKVEEEKSGIMRWVVIGLMFLFVCFLAWRLLF